VLFMVFFHLMWDLAYVGWSQVDVFSRPWQFFARSIGTLFILLMGFHCALSPYAWQTRGCSGGMCCSAAGCSLDWAC
jgi:uncharacterized membrane protein